jgi:cytochrome c oxidase assembly protein subunit 11
MSAKSPSPQQQGNRKLLTRLLVIAVAMFGFGFLLVPFYEQICEVTGLRNIAQPDEVRNTQVVDSRSIRIELDSYVRNMPWTFKPLTPVVEVHPGAVTQVVYEVTNTTGRPVTGQAIPSYGPQLAARYFQKLECFCFSDQTIAAGETIEFPVVYFVDPKFAEDTETKGKGEVTLSYTFFRSVESEPAQKHADASTTNRPSALGVTAKAGL